MAKWVMVVDDDAANLKMAGHILSKNNMRVTALKSGKLMLDYIKEHGSPDLILLDIKMPDLDGFETLDYLRKYENEMGLSETPVIFLTADETAGTETRGFEVGVSDYIRKPFNPDVLLRRIDNVINVQSEMISLKNDATIDKLTGFLNKEATNVELSKMCASKSGCLMMIDLDSFKLVNDLFGHEMGDKVLITFANIIKDTMPVGSKYGRIGGDEFVSFAKGVSEESQVAEITKKLNEDLVAAAKEMMGEDMNIPLGTSIGAIMVPKHGNDYPSLLKLADKCLYVVKKNGKHGYSIYSSELMAEEEKDAVTLDIKGISEILGERNITNVAMQLDMEAFSYVYRYATRYFLRNGINACKVLFTLDRSQNIDDEQFKNYCDDFGNFLRESLRKSDIITRSRFNQYYILITDIREEFVNRVVLNLLDRWDEKFDFSLNVNYEIDYARNDGGVAPDRLPANVVMVDDDDACLAFVNKIVSEYGVNLSMFNNGAEFINYVNTVERVPELILLDVNLPGRNGFELYEELKKIGGDISRVPVIFFTGDDDEEAEIKGLSMGAMDYIRKPLVPEILKARVNHILELIILRKRFQRGK